MGLIDTIRRAEERSKQAARRGMEMARHGWEDGERMLRRKWRVHPGQRQADAGEGSNAAQPSASMQPTQLVDAEMRRRELEGAGLRAIVSIYGRDVREEDVREKDAREEDIRRNRKLAS